MDLLKSISQLFYSFVASVDRGEQTRARAMMYQAGLREEAQNPNIFIPHPSPTLPSPPTNNRPGIFSSIENFISRILH